MRGGQVLAIGIAVLLFALIMDTSVSTGFGRVNNLGLMKDQQNYVVIASLVIGAGLIMMAMQSRASGALPQAPDVQERMKTCPECAETIRADAKVCRYCGNREFAEMEESWDDLPKLKPRPTAWQKLWWDPHAEPRKRK